MRTVAVFYQSIPTPPVAGIVKPMKRGGYANSGADIGFALLNKGYSIMTPKATPNPKLTSTGFFLTRKKGSHQRSHTAQIRSG